MTNSEVPTSNQHSFEQFLRAELVRRCRKNPKYSLRAFALSLGVGSSYLSKLLNGKRPVTTRVIQKFKTPLALAPDQVEAFNANLADGGFRSFSVEPLDLDRFKLIADWYHFAILELVTVNGFAVSAGAISQALGISPHEAGDALERLTRLGFIAPEGSTSHTPPNLSTLGPDFTISAAKRQQAQFLGKAIEALENVPFGFRDQSGMTLAIPVSRLKEANERIRKFRREFTAAMQRPGARDAVYQLSVSFYPLTLIPSPIHPTPKRKRSSK